MTEARATVSTEKDSSSGEKYNQVKPLLGETRKPDVIAGRTWNQGHLKIAFGVSLILCMLSSVGVGWLLATYLSIQRCIPRPDKSGTWTTVSTKVGPLHSRWRPAPSGSCWTELVQPIGSEFSNGNKTCMAKGDCYRRISGENAHKQPLMYGRVLEKTIWQYWYDPRLCPNSKHCRLPAFVKLCIATVKRNRGDFKYRLLHSDTVRQYVNQFELPAGWHRLPLMQQKDSLMNALLARYGGVALDVHTMLFRPLDAAWDKMVSQRATFSGYLYRHNGASWRRPETTAVWYLMARREGVFSAAVRSQLGSFCHAHDDPHLNLGDVTLTPALSMLDHKLPTCYEDEAVIGREACPELAQPLWSEKGAIAAPQMHRKLLLSDPRDGPHLPFAYADGSSMGLWQVWDETPLAPQDRASAGCKTPKECWFDVFMTRYERADLHFVTFFNGGGRLKNMSRPELLSSRNTFLWHWLSLAGSVTTPKIEASRALRASGRT